MTVREETRKLTTRQREGRAINAVAELLRRKLSVPNIYLEPPASLVSADVLAVDRGGAGDLHAVEIKLMEIVPVPVSQSEKQQAPKGRFIALSRERARRETVKSVHRQVMSMPSHFRYLAVSAGSLDAWHSELLDLGLYAEDGIGRLGLIAVSEGGSTNSPIANLVVAPERFRVDPAKLNAIETKLLAKNRPDIEVRI
ncbi:MAG: hypothetical protein ACLPH3_04585 [Terracidiphilus sp.]